MYENKIKYSLHLTLSMHSSALIIDLIFVITKLSNKSCWIIILRLAMWITSSVWRSTTVLFVTLLYLETHVQQTKRLYLFISIGNPTRSQQEVNTYLHTIILYSKIFHYTRGNPVCDNSLNIWFYIHSGFASISFSLDMFLLSTFQSYTKNVATFCGTSN